jgi:hypothetical protein
MFSDRGLFALQSCEILPKQSAVVALQDAFPLAILKHETTELPTSMKTSVSIPDEVFQQAERFARRTGVSRSQLVSDALREYVARHAPEKVTEAMNRVVASLDQPDDAFIVAASRRTLQPFEW